jgi:hypothetical protein
MGKVMGWGMRLTSARKQERAQRAPKQLRRCALLLATRHVQRCSLFVRGGGQSQPRAARLGVGGRGGAAGDGAVGRGVEPTSARKDERAARTPKQAARAALRCAAFLLWPVYSSSRLKSFILTVEPLPLLFFEPLPFLALLWAANRRSVPPLRRAGRCACRCRYQ